jgi:hypothetical protein
MAYTPTSPRSGASEPTSAGAADGDASGVAPPQHSDANHPRLIEEHRIVGPRGEDELEATDERGRRWYHLRPDPRRRADFIGFNYTWWLIWIAFIFILFLPWGRGWGY